jgi:hypothetical protein
VKFLIKVKKVMPLVCTIMSLRFGKNNLRKLGPTSVIISRLQKALHLLKKQLISLENLLSTSMILLRWTRLSQGSGTPKLTKIFLGGKKRREI